MESHCTMTTYMKIALQIARSVCVGLWFFCWFLLVKHSEDHLEHKNALLFKIALGALGLSY